MGAALTDFRSAPRFLPSNGRCRNVVYAQRPLTRVRSWPSIHETARAHVRKSEGTTMRPPPAARVFGPRDALSLGGRDHHAATVVARICCRIRESGMSTANRPLRAASPVRIAVVIVPCPFCRGQKRRSNGLPRHLGRRAFPAAPSRLVAHGATATSGRSAAGRRVCGSAAKGGHDVETAEANAIYVQRCGEAGCAERSSNTGPAGVRPAAARRCCESRKNVVQHMQMWLPLMFESQVAKLLRVVRISDGNPVDSARIL